MFDCPQCAEPTDTLHEGVCEVCRETNQDALDLHNHEYDRWLAMTPAERAAAIKWAIR